MKIDQSRFCALSANREWQEWLRGTDPNLYNDLMKTRVGGHGCRANKEAMKVIYGKLYASGLGDRLEGLIKSRFPYLILDEDGKPQMDPGITRPAPPRLQRKNFRALSNVANLNKHGVFKSYRPGLLTFPKKMIFVNGNKKQLEAIVKHFIRDKVGSDYIIIDDHAYVEFFEQRHQSEADRIKREDREIFQYRQRLSGGQT